MPTGNPIAFTDKVTEISSTPLYPIGTVRFQPDSNGVMAKYEYCQADDALTQYDAVCIDIAASANCTKVTRAGTAGQLIRGFTQVAVTDEYYFWLQTGGVMSATMKTGVAAEDPVTATSTAGACGKCSEADSTAVYKAAVRFTAITANSSGSDATRVVYAPL